MKITLCGSIGHFRQMERIKKELESLGHQVKMPSSELATLDGKKIPALKFRKLKKKAGDRHPWMWDKIQLAMFTHFKKISWSDAVLIVNLDKNKIKNYIGGNTLIEMGVALYLKKKIFLLDPIPQIKLYKEEILAIKPVVINGDLKKIG